MEPVGHIPGKGGMRGSGLGPMTPAPGEGRGGRREPPTLPNPQLSWIFGAQPHAGGWQPVNDPSAGSPTETLLRLLLPLDSQV